MTVDISIVMGFRDREIARVRRCLDSLAAQSFRDFEVLFVDYGSRASVAAEVRRTVREHGFARYLYSETRGRPWNRSQALNIGIRRATGHYIMTTDVDMIFAPDFLQSIAGRCSDDRVLYTRHFYLPRGFDDWKRLHVQRARFARAPTSAYGACQVAPAQILRELRGFDEYFCYWGIEDRDLNHRLIAAGLDEVWVDDDAFMFHQWHPSVDIKTPGFIPAGLWGRMEMHHQKLANELIRNSTGWGEPLTLDDRPVLSFIDELKGEVLKRSGLQWFGSPTSDPRSVSRLVRAFWSLEPGEAIAVRGANLPARSSWLDLCLRVANKFLRTLGTDSEVGYSFNALHTFIAEMAHERPDALADYYLSLQGSTNVSLLLRGSVESLSVEE